ncbi:Acetate/butyrate--CoA ligase AAE7, peroxisomal [Cytospora mali]|uniref:Acetate/butyrate--CoA ligase AAE7, peroxisomal n=1 Tax=Cytospora mali TaxID=578113 RepID=A0A194V5S5_CYTMA|nr:Acetate/butyrate--CoA ligase AAE7, peroxisomal [Valsa mali var. pyri (nom. inval.)]
MSGPPSRLRSILGHILPSSSQPSPPSTATTTTPPLETGEQKKHQHTNHIHTLSPTIFLPRAASIEPQAEAIVHITANGAILRRTYQEFADRARGLAYYLKTHGFKRVGVLMPNTPAFLECVYGIVAGGAVIVPANYRLKEDDVSYIFAFADVEVVVVDWEFEGLLARFREARPGVKVVVDTDTDATEGELGGPFDDIVLEGLTYDRQNGSKGWEGLHVQAENEDGVLAIPFTSGTTSRPKGVMYTHRGAYLAALGNVIESGLNVPDARCKYLWTLPLQVLFHAIGWTFAWATVAVRGTNICLRKIDYPLVWRLLKEERVTHFNAAPTVNTLLCADPNAERLEQACHVTVAASPPTGHLFEQMIALNLHPVHVYGMTETYGPITKGYIMPEWDALEPSEKYSLMARQGHGFVTSLPVRVVKMDQPEGVLVDVAKDGSEIGEVIFSGNICAKGYFKDPEATQRLFAGGALHSGDLAVWHPDGAVQILDRAKDIIISGGENISSVALESMLVNHPDVLEAGVVAVADSHWGERPKAYVTIKEGKHVEGKDIVDWAKHQSQISRFMVPREVEVISELPKTSTGKIKKTVLREWAKHGQHKE